MKVNMAVRLSSGGSAGAQRALDVALAHEVTRNGAPLLRKVAAEMAREE